MNLTQMHERLRFELLRRIQRGTLSVSLLARQAGFGQSHISNFLRSRRQLSLEALDRVLVSQHMSVWDLLPFDRRRADILSAEAGDTVPLVSHSVAMSEPNIRHSTIRAMLQLPPGWVKTVRARPFSPRQKWHRFVAISISSSEAIAMDPLLQPDALTVIDRHYNSLLDYHPSRKNIYAVRHGNRLLVRYLDFAANRMVLRPHNRACTVDLLEIPPGENVGELVVGRIALVLNEL